MSKIGKAILLASGLVLLTQAATAPAPVAEGSDSDVLKIEVEKENKQVVLPPAAKIQTAQNPFSASQDFWLQMYESINKLGSTVLGPQSYMYQPMSEPQIRKYYSGGIPLVTKLPEKPNVQKISPASKPVSTQNGALITSISDAVADSKPGEGATDQPKQDAEKDYTINVEVGNDGNVKTSLETKPSQNVDPPKTSPIMKPDQLAAFLEKLKKESASAQDKKDSEQKSVEAEKAKEADLKPKTPQKPKQAEQKAIELPAPEKKIEAEPKAAQEDNKVSSPPASK